MRYVLIKKAAELSGYTEEAIQAKINKGQWAEGIHYLKAPDGRIFIDLDNLEKWITQGLKQGGSRLKSPGSTRASASAKL